MTKPIAITWEMYDAKVDEFMKYTIVMGLPEAGQKQAAATLELFGVFLIGRRQKTGE